MRSVWEKTGGATVKSPASASIGNRKPFLDMILVNIVPSCLDVFAIDKELCYKQINHYTHQVNKESYRPALHETSLIGVAGDTEERNQTAAGGHGQKICR
jgi:hypothetical protein